jgi:hypothetical protein
MTRARKIRARLGAPDSYLLTGAPPRPPRMHHSTYQRLVQELLEAERRALPF